MCLHNNGKYNNNYLAANLPTYCGVVEDSIEYHASEDVPIQDPARTSPITKLYERKYSINVGRHAYKKHNLPLHALLTRRVLVPACLRMASVFPTHCVVCISSRRIFTPLSYTTDFTHKTTTYLPLHIRTNPTAKEICSFVTEPQKLTGFS